MGHANIDVTQNVYGKGWWGASGCGHPSCRSRNQCRSKCRERREKRISLNLSATNGCPRYAGSIIKKHEPDEPRGFGWDGGYPIHVNPKSQE